ncbi:MAG: wax ester/triacylglycerol synthase domain-containing protein, partial [Microthrixaceae bacterium]
MNAAGQRANPDSPVHFDDRMSDTDALMWTIEKDPMLRSTITTAMVLDGVVDPELVHRTFDRASRIIPRLRQRVRSNPLSMAPPRWEIDPNFDLRYHLRSARVPGTGSMSDLLAMAGPVSMQGFDRARPLWEATLVDGLAGGRSAILLKFHHSITDGVGGVELMLELFDLEADAEDRPMPDEPLVHVLNQTERFVDAFHHESRRQAALARRYAATGIDSLRGAAHDPTGSLVASGELLGSVTRILRPEATPLSAIMTRRSLSSRLDVLSMPLDLAKKVGNRIGGTLN